MLKEDYIEITHENFEELVHKVTILFIFENGKLRERLANKKWMSRDEGLRYVDSFKDMTLPNLINFMGENNLFGTEGGSTQVNMLSEFAQWTKLWSKLMNKGVDVVSNKK
jgi:hypothetical protein